MTEVASLVPESCRLVTRGLVRISLDAAVHHIGMGHEPEIEPVTPAADGDQPDGLVGLREKEMGTLNVLGAVSMSQK